MAIELDQPTAGTRPPVVGARGLGQAVIGMVIDKEVRARQDRDGKPILNSRGKPAQEEVLTVMVLAGTTGTVSGGDLADDRVPDVGEVCRLIFRGLGYGKLIDARRAVGGTQVGDVITVTAPSATIWRGAGDIHSKDVTDAAIIDKARAKGLSVGWDLDVAYRRHTAGEAALVAKAEAAHVEHRARIELDTPARPAVDDLEAF
jgi:hypothetical protein